MSAPRVDRPVVATVGFAARANGDGVAYAAIRGSEQSEEQVVRVPFACTPLPALLGRDVAYAATEALAAELLRRNLRRVLFRIDEDNLAHDIADRRALPTALTVPYVRLRCTLNRFREARIVRFADRTSRDLTARARAEALLDIAA